MAIKEKLELRGFRIYPRHHKIISKIAKRDGVSQSEVIRKIIDTFRPSF